MMNSTAAAVKLHDGDREKSMISIVRAAALSLLMCFPILGQDLDRVVTAMAKMNFSIAPSFSPDGAKLAYLTNISGSPQVWIVETAGGYPKAVTAFDDPVSAMAWSPASDDIAVLVAPGGGLNTQIYLVKPDGTNLRRITPGGKENNWLGVWSSTGKYLTYSSNIRSGAAMDGMLYDVTTGKSRMIAENRGVGNVEDVSTDGRYALVNRAASRGDNNVHRIDIESGADVLVTPHTPPGRFSGKFGADSSTIYLMSNEGRDLTAFGRVSIRGGKAGRFELLQERRDAELDDFELDPQQRRAVLFWNVGGRNELELIDLASGKMTAVPKLPGDQVTFADFSNDGSMLALATVGAKSPADIHVWKIGSKSPRRVVESSHAGVDLASLRSPELVTYRAHDGLELSGWLYRPEGKGPFPTVLSFHGGPEGQERPSMNPTYQGLLSRGIAVFAPNVRGSSGFGKKFVNLDNGPLRVNGVRDIEASVKAVVDRGIADPARVGIMGGSYGGYMVMAGMTEYPDMFRAGANLFGVVNFETFFKHSEPWMAEISTIEYGDPKTQGEMLKSLSPIHKLDRLKGALLVLHGANDTNVPVIEAEQIVERLKARNVPVEYILFPDEGHGWRETPNRVRSAVSIVNFFDKHLKK